MKKLLQLFVAILCFNVAANAQVTASFADSLGDMCQPQTISFLDFSSGGPSSWTWDFGDGGSSTLQNPVYTYQASGSYAVTLIVADSVGSDSATMTITVGAAMTATITTINESSTNMNDGSATVSVSGGVNPYSYFWSNQVLTATNNGLTAGIYCVTVTDGNGCNIAACATITTDSTTTNAPLAQFSMSPSTGCGPLNVAFVDASSNSPTSWSWDFGDGTTSTLQNPTHIYSVAGTYSIVMIASNSAGSSTATGSVSVMDSPIIQPSTVNETAANACDGGATATVSGGTIPYSYMWSDSSATATIGNLCAGTYTLDVTDANGCTANATVVVGTDSTTAVLLAQFSMSTTSGCGTTSVAFTDLSSGGPISWLWDFGDGNTSTAQNPTNSYTAVGTYNVILIVSDVQNLTDTAVGTIVITAGPTVTTSSTNETSAGACDGTATAAVSGGASPYSYMWSDSTASATAIGLCGGTYSLDVTDAAGCMTSATVSISTDSSTTVSPLYVAVQTTGTSCGGICDGSATLTASGGTLPYSYSWDNGGASATIGNLCSGVYSYVVTDANGVNSQGYVMVTSASIMTVLMDTIPVTSASCGNADGGVSIMVSGGTIPYSYAWSNGATGSSLSNVAGGMYSVLVTDGSGCQATASFVIPDLSGPTVSILGTTNANCGGADGAIYTGVSGGTSPYTYLWDNGATAQNMLDAAAGTHYVQVTDASGCVGSASATILTSGGSAPTLSGMVTTTNGDTVTGGAVIVYTDAPYLNPYDIVAITSIDNQGNYYFSSILPVGNYLVKAIPDSLLFPYAVATFFGLTHQWDLAGTVTAVCDANLTADLIVIDLNPLGGTSNFGGFVSSSVNGKLAAAGDPIPGIDVSLEQVPGGIVATDETDADGGYDFDNVPTGPTFEYKIHVDIPGLPMAQTYSINPISTDTSAIDLDFLVDDTEIFIDSSTDIKPSKVTRNAFTMYPNPTNGKLYLLGSDEIGLVEVIDVTGKVLSVDNTVRTSKSIDLSSLNNGIYFIKVNVGGRTVIKKIAKN